MMMSMKLPRKLLLFSILVVLTIIASVGAYASWRSEHYLLAAHNNAETITFIVDNSKDKLTEPEPTDSTPETAPINRPVEKPTEAPIAKDISVEPTVLSTYEYAEKYLNIEGQGKTCFDAIVARYPKQFTMSLREQNIKALRAFGSTCRTGVMSSNCLLDFFNFTPEGPTYKKGSFFTSELAKKYAAMP